MPIFGDPLMPATPGGPRQNTLHALLEGQHETPKEAPNLAHTERHTNPHDILKAVRLPCVEPCVIFFNGSMVGTCAAWRTVNKA